MQIDVAPTADFSSFLLQAQSSGAKVIGLANAGTDTINSIKQAGEFGLTQRGQALAGLLVFASDVKALGLRTAQGLVLSETFYWDLNDQTRAFSKRFGERHSGKMPTMVHAGVYAGVLHYLKAVQALNGKEPQKVMAKMKEMPTDDPLFGKGRIRADGRKIHDAYLFRVKTPQEAKGEWDLYQLLATVPGDQDTIWAVRSGERSASSTRPCFSARQSRCEPACAWQRPRSPSSPFRARVAAVAGL
jgi:branched-chain amino acid transport system substrate-binding protein